MGTENSKPTQNNWDNSTELAIQRALEQQRRMYEAKYSELIQSQIVIHESLNQSRSSANRNSSPSTAALNSGISPSNSLYPNLQPMANNNNPQVTTNNNHNICLPSTSNNVFQLTTSSSSVPSACKATSSSTVPSAPKTTSSSMVPSAPKATSSFTVPAAPKATSSSTVPAAPKATSFSSVPSAPKATSSSMVPSAPKATSSFTLPAAPKATSSSMVPAAPKATSFSSLPSAPKATSSSMVPSAPKATSSSMVPAAPKATSFSSLPSAPKATSSSMVPSAPKATSSSTVPSAPKATSSSTVPAAPKATSFSSVPSAPKATSLFSVPSPLKVTSSCTNPSPQTVPDSGISVPSSLTTTTTPLISSTLGQTNNNNDRNFSNKGAIPKNRRRYGKKKIISVGVECVTCKNDFGLQIYQCQNGHSSCNGCRFSNRACGLCSKPITDVRNIMLETTVAELTIKQSAEEKMKCPNAKAGCCLSFFSNELDNHLKECPYNDMECPLKFIYKTCTWKGNINQISTHFNELHPLHCVADVDKEMTIKNITVDQRLVYFVTIGSFNFLLHFKVIENEKIVYMTAQLLGTKVSASKWTYELHIYNKKEPRRKFLYNDVCHSNAESVNDIFKEAKCAVLHVDYLKTFVNDGCLNYKFFLKKCYA